MYPSPWYISDVLDNMRNSHKKASLLYSHVPYSSQVRITEKMQYQDK